MKLLAVVLLLSFVSPAYAQEYLSARFTGKLDERRKFVLATTAEPYSPRKHGSIKHFWGGDGAGYEPATVAASLQLTVDGIQMHLPREALLDLGDPGLPYGPVLWRDSGQIMVEWHGSDAAGGYTARFIFSGKRLLRREIFRTHSSTPNKPVDVKEFE